MKTQLIHEQHGEKTFVLVFAKVISLDLVMMIVVVAVTGVL